MSNYNERDYKGEVIDADFVELESGEGKVEDDYDYTYEPQREVTQEERDEMRRMRHNRNKEVDDSIFTSEELEKVEELVNILDWRNFETVEKFGQKEMVESNRVTEDLVNDDKLKESKMGRNLGELKTFIEDNRVVDFTKTTKKNESWFKNPVTKTLAVFGGKKDEVMTLNTSVNANLMKIEAKLKENEYELVEDNRTLEKLFDANKDLHRNIKVLIEASDRKIKQLKEEEIPELERLYNKNKNDERRMYDLRDAQDYLERLETRRHNFIKLENYTGIRAPQIRAMQTNNSELMSKLTDSIVLTIPLWKGLFTTAIQAQNTSNTLKITEGVDNLTNSLITETAEMVKSTSIEVEKQRHRGILDDKTLLESSKTLLEGIREVENIRMNAERTRQESIRVLEETKENMAKEMLRLNDVAIENRKTRSSSTSDNISKQ